MAKVTWLGEDDGDIAGPSFTTWHGMKFDKGKPVDITDMGILNKAKGNRFFKVEGGPGRPPNPPKEDAEQLAHQRGYQPGAAQTAR